MTTESSAARQQILETASELFYQKGIQHVGINEVLQSQVLPNEHIVGSLQRQADWGSDEAPCTAVDSMVWKAVTDRGNTPKEQLLATFDVLRE